MSFDIIKEITDRTIKTGEENGAAVVITKDGKKIFSCGAGKADFDTGLDFDETTICRAFSCTKVVTGTACMILMERGLLDTSTELRYIIPEFSDMYYVRDHVKIRSPHIKIRDLLNMTSGIAYPGGGFEGIEGMNELWWQLEQSIRAGKSMTTLEFAQEAGKKPLLFPVGHEWMYGSSADILGAVIEKVADTDLAEFFSKNIFEPLGMNDTAFFVPKDKRNRLAALYENAWGTHKKTENINLCIFDYDEQPAFKSGGAGLFTTAEDMSKLGAALSNGGAGIISPRTIDFMREGGLTEEQRKTFNWDSVRGFNYANLVRTLEDRNSAGLMASNGAFGWDGWTGTYLLCDPAEKLSITVFVQRCGAGTTALSRRIVNAAYANIIDD